MTSSASSAVMLEQTPMAFQLQPRFQSEEEMTLNPDFSDVPAAVHLFSSTVDFDLITPPPRSFLSVDIPS